VRVLRITSVPARLQLSKHPQNLFTNALQPLQHFMIPESDHSKAARFQFSRPRIIVPFALLGMLVAVDLDDQPPATQQKSTMYE
jgi:hypothetical protein